MLEKKRSSINGLYENIGKLCVFSVFAYSAFVLITSFCKKDKDGDYQERLRKAYEGLSPEEY